MVITRAARVQHTTINAAEKIFLAPKK